MEIVRYKEEHEQIWDAFVNENSINGTFLQTRAFLNYHPTDKFQDCSLIFCKPSNLNQPYAVVPAHEYIHEGKKVFSSHDGSTFGGIIVSKIRYNVNDVLEILDCFDSWLKENHYDKVILKITSDIFSFEKTDLLQYVLWYRGYMHYCELSTYIDYTNYASDILSNFDRNKMRNVKKAHARQLESKFLFQQNEIKCFYEILCENLLKFGAKPVHTINELLDIKQRLGESVAFYAVFDNDKMVAGSMLFYFKNVNAYHLQYTCAKQDITDYSPMIFLWYKLISFAHECGSKYLSFGISTEQKGCVLNKGLIMSKESYGSKYAVNRTYFRNI